MKQEKNRLQRIAYIVAIAYIVIAVIYMIIAFV